MITNFHSGNLCVVFVKIKTVILWIIIKKNENRKNALILPLIFLKDSSGVVSLTKPATQPASSTAKNNNGISNRIFESNYSTKYHSLVLTPSANLSTDEIYSQVFVLPWRVDLLFILLCRIYHKNIRENQVFLYTITQKPKMKTN